MLCIFQALFVVAGQVPVLLYAYNVLLFVALGFCFSP